jgi:hypothetical protein
MLETVEPDELDQLHRPAQAGEDLEQRGLAAPAWSHDHHEFAVGNPEIDVLQGQHATIRAGIPHADAANRNDIAGAVVRQCSRRRSCVQTYLPTTRLTLTRLLAAGALAEGS